MATQHSKFSPRRAGWRQTCLALSVLGAGCLASGTAAAGDGPPFGPAFNDILGRNAASPADGDWWGLCTGKLAACTHGPLFHPAAMNRVEVNFCPGKDPASCELSSSLSKLKVKPSGILCRFDKEYKQLECVPVYTAMPRK